MRRAVVRAQLALLRIVVRDVRAKAGGQCPATTPDAQTACQRVQGHPAEHAGITPDGVLVRWAQVD